MLNEGWDVLNLYDIVRLYDTRDANGGKPGKTTMQEAQLIGRGARYMPFRDPSDDSLPIDKRKYDCDVANPCRVVENCIIIVLIIHAISKSCATPLFRLVLWPSIMYKSIFYER